MAVQIRGRRGAHLPQKLVSWRMQVSDGYPAFWRLPIPLTMLPQVPLPPPTPPRQHADVDDRDGRDASHAVDHDLLVHTQLVGVDAMTSVNRRPTSASRPYSHVQPALRAAADRGIEEVDQREVPRRREERERRQDQ